MSGASFFQIGQMFPVKTILTLPLIGLIPCRLASCTVLCTIKYTNFVMPGNMARVTMLVDVPCVLTIEGGLVHEEDPLLQRPFVIFS